MRTVMVTREACEWNMRGIARGAERHPRLRQHEWEMGLDQADVDESIALARAEVRRYQAILAWFDAAGLTEAEALPAHLLYDAWHARGGAR